MDIKCIAKISVNYIAAMIAVEIIIAQLCQDTEDTAGLTAMHGQRLIKKEGNDMKNKEGYPDPTAEYAINKARWEELQKLREKEHRIRRGEILTLKYMEREDEGERTKKMEVIGLYKHFVLLRSREGIRESMSCRELNRRRVP